MNDAPLHVESRERVRSQEMTQIVLQVVLAVLVVLATLWFWRYAERRRRLRFSNRSECDFDDWYRRFYCSDFPSQKDGIEAILSVFAETVGVDKTRLLPSDRLSVELAMPEASGCDDTVNELEERLSGLIDVQFEIPREWRTVDEVIRGVLAIDPKFGRRVPLAGRPPVLDRATVGSD